METCKLESGQQSGDHIGVGKGKGKGDAKGKGKCNGKGKGDAKGKGKCKGDAKGKGKGKGAITTLDCWWTRQYVYHGVRPTRCRCITSMYGEMKCRKTNWNMRNRISTPPTT